MKSFGLVCVGALLIASGLHAADQATDRQTADRQIRQSVQDAINGGWFGKGYEQVVFEVDNGTVVLRGLVITPEDKETLSQRVQKLAGVRRVENQVRVANAQGNSNANIYGTPRERAQAYSNEQQKDHAKLREKIKSALEGGWFSKKYEQVSYDLNGDRVVLRGFVVTEVEKKDAEDRVRGAGATRVENQIHVRPEGAQGYNNGRDAQGYNNGRDAGANNMELEKKVHEALKGGWFSKGYDTVNYRVINGNVILTGYVRSESDRETIQKRIADIKGVRNIDNQVGVDTNAHR